MDINRLNLDYNEADLILDDFDDDCCSETQINLYPNLPKVKEICKPYIVRESSKWILTQGISMEAHNLIEDIDMSPFYGCNDTFESFKNRYYGQEKE